MQSLMFKIPALLFFLFLNVAILSGCNTMSGVGEDMESAGDAIEDSADKNKSY